MITLMFNLYKSGLLSKLLVPQTKTMWFTNTDELLTLVSEGKTRIRVVVSAPYGDDIKDKMRSIGVQPTPDKITEYVWVILLHVSLRLS